MTVSGENVHYFHPLYRRTKKIAHSKGLESTPKDVHRKKKFVEATFVFKRALNFKIGCTRILMTLKLATDAALPHVHVTLQMRVLSQPTFKEQKNMQTKSNSTII